MKTELGAYLDPLADKVLIVSIYVTLGITGVIPLWIVILVVSRDIMIVGAIILSWLVDRPVADQAAHRSPSSTPRRRSCSPAWCWPRTASISTPSRC